MSRLDRIVVWFALCLPSMAGQLASAQDEPVAEAAAPEAADSAGADDFDALFTDWKTNLADLRDIYQEYQNAEESELADLEKQWKERIAKGKAMERPLRDAALVKYAAAPNADRQLTKFLLKLVADHIKSDDYPAALQICQKLVEHNCDEREIDNLTGVAAFGSNNFELAEAHLIEASRDGTLSEQGQQFFAALPECQTAWKEELKLREAEAGADDLPRVELVTDVGKVVLELFENEAPETVGNFLNLVDKGFYDGLTFHRVLQGFVAQGGCPKGDGTGGPGYKIYCECLDDNHRKHFAGSVSMAKEPANHTGGSQFFLCFVPRPDLNGRHTVFGRVIEGMDVLPKIQKRDPSQPQALADPTVIERVEILRKRDHEYRPNKVK